MLVSLSKNIIDPPEEAEMNVTLTSNVADQEKASLWFGNPFRLRAILRDGTPVSIGLNMTECVEIYNLLHKDKNIRDWAEMLEFRLGAFGTDDSGSSH